MDGPVESVLAALWRRAAAVRVGCRRSERYVGVVDGVCGGEWRGGLLLTQDLLNSQAVASSDALAQFARDLEDCEGLLRRAVGGQRDRPGRGVMAGGGRRLRAPRRHDLPALGRAERRCSALSAARALAALSR